MDDKGRPTSLEEIAALPKDVLVPTDVAAYLKVKTYSINCACKAGTLPWAYQMGANTMIPKGAFLHWHGYGATVRSTVYGANAETHGGEEET